MRPVVAIAPALDERQREDERLRHGLNRELGVIVARGPHPAAGTYDGEGEPFRIGVRKLGDIARRRAAAERPDLVESFGQQRGDGVHGSTIMDAC